MASAGAPPLNLRGLTITGAAEADPDADDDDDDDETLEADDPALPPCHSKAAARGLETMGAALDNSIDLCF